MPDHKFTASTLLAIFRRKGGEGLLTKIVTGQNGGNFPEQIALLGANEQALLCCRHDEHNWLLLTDSRIIHSDRFVRSIAYATIADVCPALRDEYNDGIRDKADFIRIVLQDNNGAKHILNIEKGAPYHGVYQILHHIASRNRIPT